VFIGILFFGVVHSTTAGYFEKKILAGLNPTNDGLTDKLPPLKIGFKQEQGVVSREIEDATYQTYIATIFIREVEKNICIPGSNKKGIIEIKVIYDNCGKTAGGHALSVFSIMTLGTLNLFVAMPAAHIRRNMQVEITIYDNSQNVIKRYAYTKSDHTITGVYWGNRSDKNNLLQIRVVKAIIHQFKMDVEKDVSAIKAGLEN
jgi:phosphotransacetylase